MNIVRTSVEIGGKTIWFETGKLAKQASGAVVVGCGDSALLCTVVMAGGNQPFDFLPLTVDYQDRNGASGTIPGGYLKREGRASERETLISRLIDRPLRPLFPKHLRQEIQVMVTAMSYDRDNETDVLSVCGCAAACHVSDVPMAEACAAVRIVRVDGALVLNPSYDQRQRADMDLVIAGTATAITMVEGGAQQVDEAIVLDAFDLASEAIGKIVACINDLRAQAGRAKVTIAAPKALDADALAGVFAKGEAGLRDALKIPGKHERKAGLKAVRDGVIAELVAGMDSEKVAGFTADCKEAWEKLVRKVMRQDVIETGIRLDGRKTDEIRNIWIELGAAARAHGSAIFTRGETQGFVTCALGTDMDSQRMELPSGKADRRFMLTYGFPPFCTGEAKRLAGPKRREVGHGALAHRALQAVVPDKSEFPYVIRVASEILESNGSSSMATVCGGTLAMMDAGVPIKAPVAGIAMGLVSEGDKFAVLSDILGDEDALGDMDFKVTGTTKGITAFQMDVKIHGLPRAVMAAALEQARVGRLHILGCMNEAIAAPRAELSAYAPRITTIKIKNDRIKDLIGPGGKTIRAIQDACEVRLTVDDSGKVEIASTSGEATDRAVAMIRELTQEAEIGALYVGVVKRIVDFGAFVEIFPGTDGLVHISELAAGRVDKVTDVISEGDEVLVRVIDVDRAGKIRLSRKAALGTAL